MAEHVLVLVSQPPAGGLDAAAGEALGAGRELASRLELPLACAIVGHDVDAAAVEAAERGADRVLVADGEHLARFQGDATVPAAGEAVRAAEARVVIVSRGPDLLELAPRLAARLDGGSVVGASELRPGADGALEVVTAVFGGAAQAVYRFTAEGARIVGVGAAIADAPPREAGRTAERAELDVTPPVQERVRVVRPAAAAEGPRLEDARIVVSGGCGLKESENYARIRELAAALGGMPRRLARDRGRGLGGAGRAGWPHRHAGRPRRLLRYRHLGREPAHGGLLQLARAGGVNNDSDAPIFRFAHPGIVGDAQAVLPELIRVSAGVTVAGG